MIEHGNWGPWRLNRHAATLDLHDDSGGYWVDRDRCTGPAEVLDWICQIAHKTWADDATLAALVRALDDVLRPQANLCPNGQAAALTTATIRQKVRDFAAGHGD